MTLYACYGDFQELKEFCKKSFSPNEISLRHYGNSATPITYIIAPVDVFTALLSDHFQLIEVEQISFVDEIAGFTDALGTQVYFE